VSSDQSPIILAFSGGLDTSFCVPWLKEHLGRDVITATVDTGGIDSAAAAALEERALALGAIEHVLIDCKEDFFTTVIRHLIAGNVLRGQAYPLCVGAERGLQAARLAQLAIERGATTVAHGCTAAGNDQVRFEVALRTLSPGLEILAPVPRETQAAVARPGLRLLDQPRSLGHYDRRPRNADLRELDRRRRLGIVSPRIQRAAGTLAAYTALRGRHPGRSRRHRHAARRADRST
jgi:hypothetical protein